MVSAEELTSEQHAELHADLTELKRQLTASIAAADERTGVVDLDQEIGRLSRMDALQHQKMAEAEQARHKLRLKMVIRALQSFDDEEYGYCTRCGEPIAYLRLKARPESPCCVPCLSAVELKR